VNDKIMQIDLNSDLGEGFGAYRIGDDEKLLDIVTSANVACGYHAGDPVIMDRTVRLALARGVDLGAHVSYPDLMGFGRRLIQMDLSELERHILYQLGALYGIATAAGHRVTHLNAHGALGNQVCAERAVADVLARAVSSFDSKIRLLVLPGTELDYAAREAGLPTANLFLADRAYDDTGRLVARKIPGSVIKDDSSVLQRVRQLLKDGTITTFTGKTLQISVQSILVHSDTPGAVRLAGTIRSEIEAAGGRVVPLSRLA
jgi:UPF0271 protein